MKYIQDVECFLSFCIYLNQIFKNVSKSILKSGIRVCVILYKLICFNSDENVLSPCFYFSFAFEVNFCFANLYYKSITDFRTTFTSFLLCISSGKVDFKTWPTLKTQTLKKKRVNIIE